jgi:hypothetical protein
MRRVEKYVQLPLTVGAGLVATPVASISLHDTFNSQGSSDVNCVTQMVHEDKTRIGTSDLQLLRPESWLLAPDRRSGPGFLKQDTLLLIFSPQKTSACEKTRINYGFGWEIHDAGDPDPGNHGAMRRFEHGGGAVGSSSVLIIYPDQRVVIAGLQNSDDFRDWPMFKVAAPFFSHGGEVQPTRRPASAEKNADKWQRHSRRIAFSVGTGRSLFFAEIR